MPGNLRFVATSVLFFIVVGPAVPALELTAATLFTKGRFEIMPAFFLAAVLFGALIAAALGLAHGVLMALALRVAPLRRWLATPARRVVLGAGIALLCGLAMAAVTLYIARNSYGSLLGAMDPNHPDPWKIIRAYMVIELFIAPAIVCGILFQLLPWSRRVMQRALGQA